MPTLSQSELFGLSTLYTYLSPFSLVFMYQKLLDFRKCFIRCHIVSTYLIYLFLLVTCLIPNLIFFVLFSFLLSSNVFTLFNISSNVLLTIFSLISFRILFHCFAVYVLRHNERCCREWMVSFNIFIYYKFLGFSYLDGHCQILTVIFGLLVTV